MEIKEQVLKIRRERKPERVFAYITHVGPYMGDQQLFAKLFTKVLKWAEENDQVHPNLEAITIYHDDPEAVPAEQQRVDVGVTIPSAILPSGDLHVMRLPERDFIVGAFEIHATEYGLAWNQVMNWIADRNLEIGLFPMYESYLNDPQTHPEGKHIVDICVPLK